MVLTVLQATSERNEHSCPEMISRISPEHVKVTKNQIMESEKYGTGRNLEKLILFFSIWRRQLQAYYGHAWWMFVYPMLKNLLDFFMYLLDYFTVFKIVTFFPHLKLIWFVIILSQYVKLNNIFFLMTSYILKDCYHVPNLVFSSLDWTNPILSVFLKSHFQNI